MVEDLALEPDCLDSNPSSASYQLCDLGKVTQPLATWLPHLSNGENDNSAYFLNLL